MQFDLLAIRNETFVRSLIYREELESTNSTLTDLVAEESLESPALVLAGLQTAGRGRGGNEWHSAAGSLTFSVLIEFPMLPIERLASFSLTVGLAVCQAIESFAPTSDTTIKWPNDVYLDGKKLAGVLVERPWASEPSLVIGIGVNLNNDLAQAPREIRSSAISMIQTLGGRICPNQFLIECLQQLERRSKDHIHYPEKLLDQWRSYCFLSGRNVSILVGQETVYGVCLGIDDSGALLVDTPGGVRAVSSGVVAAF